MKNNMVKLVKAWMFKDSNTYGEKEFWLNTDFEVMYIEACKMNKNGVEIECTRLVYQDYKITVVGTPQQFFEACKNSNTAICLLSNLQENGITMKEFLEQNKL